MQRRDSSALPGEAGPRNVELTERKLSMLRTGACFDLVGQVAVDHVHDAAEEGDPERLSLGLVGGARPHLVERAWPSPHVEAADGPGRRVCPPGHLGHAEYGLDPQRLAQVLEESLGVRVQEERRLVAGPDAGRLDLGLVDGTRPQLQVLEDLVGDGELDRPGELEAVAPDQLGRRSHPADEVVLLQTEHPHAAARHDGGGGQAVVPCSDDNDVVVRHWHGTVATGSVACRNCS